VGYLTYWIKICSVGHKKDNCKLIIVLYWSKLLDHGRVQRNNNIFKWILWTWQSTKRYEVVLFALINMLETLGWVAKTPYNFSTSFLLTLNKYCASVR
jgi:hypothetical protein